MTKLKKPAPRSPTGNPSAPKPPSSDASAASVAKRPDAPAALVAKHARNLARQVRVDLAALAAAKVVAADADRLEALAATLDAAQEAWLVTQDARNLGAVAQAREPVRAGRDHVFAALRTFAEANPTTQSTLDDIADVQGDDDLISDTTRVLALAQKHRKDLDGTDLTDARLSAIRVALNHFIAVRGGARPGFAGTAQVEDEAARNARRARNRAFWALADLDRQVARRGQYAFREDDARRARYGIYRRNTTGAAVIDDATPVG